MQNIFAQQFADLPSITGLDFKKSGSRWIAACYMDGKPHSQKDKTYAVLKDKGIFLKENGGEDLSLPEFLSQYGDSSRLNEFDRNKEAVRIEEPERIFVDPLHYESTIPREYRGNLYLFLSKLFGSERVKSVFHRYNVGEIGQSNVVYWYMNEAGQVCHDSIIPYMQNGKRSKDRGGYRRFKVDMGYSGTTLFGTHLIPNWKGEICVLESEKAAVIMTLVDPSRLWLGTGGSAKFNGIKPDFLLFPDFDQAGSFWECFGCMERNGKDCIISIENGKIIKGWGCTLANKNIKYWWKGLLVKDGWAPDDFVLNKLKTERRKT